MHVKESFEVTLQSGWLSFLTQQEFLEFHQMVTSIVLGTDMAKHVEILSQFKSKLSVGDFDTSKTGDLTLVFQMLIKMADISNQTRPWETARIWTDLIMEEFYRQGDQEEEKHLSKSPFMDRTSTRVATCQGAFIKFFVSPMLDAVSKYIDSQHTGCGGASTPIHKRRKLKFRSNHTHDSHNNSETTTPVPSRQGSLLNVAAPDSEAVALDTYPLDSSSSSVMMVVTDVYIQAINPTSRKHKPHNTKL
ncbi:high affinity cGMP-specific 3',5'-cyclic phosphodiesterase 9A [Pelomyxa schiedti]|nr:high affinity cGMP-specific 3',5'-cyclic phosphodiesterase 9A [Pelomyxa schiedti]